MIAMRCKECQCIDLEVRKGYLFCNSCGKELKLYMTEFVLLDAVLVGEPYRYPLKEKREVEIIQVKV